jgi:hypothetical protein
MSLHLVLLKAGLKEVIMRLWRWLVMVLSFSAVYAAVATVTRFRVLEALFGDHKRDHGIWDSRDIRAHNLLKY